MPPNATLRWVPRQNVSPIRRWYDGDVTVTRCKPSIPSIRIGSKYQHQSRTVPNHGEPLWKCAQDFSQFFSYLWWILWNWRFHAAECLAICFSQIANQQMNPGAYDWNHVNINIHIIANTSWLFQNSKWRDQYWYLIHLNASQYPTTKSINKNVDKGNASSSLRRAKPVWPPRNSVAWKIFCQQMPTSKQFQSENIVKYCPKATVAVCRHQVLTGRHSPKLPECQNTEVLGNRTKF